LECFLFKYTSPDRAVDLSTSWHHFTCSMNDFYLPVFWCYTLWGSSAAAHNRTTPNSFLKPT